MNSTLRNDWKKKLCLSLSSIVLFFLLLEAGTRIVMYQLDANHTLAIGELIERAADAVARNEAHDIVADLEESFDLPCTVPDAPYLPDDPLAVELLRDLERRYEECFVSLIAEVSALRAPLVVIFIPHEEYDSPSERATLARIVPFFAGLCERHHVPFLDMTDLFLQHPSDVVTFLPDDTHLTRFGHYLVAMTIKSYVGANLSDAESPVTFPYQPGLLGDLEPDDNCIEDEESQTPFRVITNCQGLRMLKDLVFPKTKQRILVLGDSVTYGPGVDTDHTFCGILNKKCHAREFVNAGVSGYTISDELELLRERARYVEPDIVILQVSNNDVSGLFCCTRNLLGRGGKTYAPTEAEARFIDRFQNKGKRW